VPIARSVASPVARAVARSVAGVGGGLRLPAIIRNALTRFLDGKKYYPTALEGLRTLYPQERFGSFRAPRQGRCWTFDGVDDKLISDSVTGTTIVEKIGTATLTIGTGEITATAGTLSYLKLSNGSEYWCNEESGSIGYDSSGNGNHLTITNATLSTFHAADSGITYNPNNEFGYRAIGENLLLQSESLDESPWAALRCQPITAGPLTPNGKPSWTFSEDPSSGTAVRQLDQGGIVTPGGPLTFSAVAKRIGRNLRLYIRETDTDSNRIVVNYDLQQGAIIGPGTVIGTATLIDTAIDSLGDDWYKITITFSMVSNSVRPVVFLIDELPPTVNFEAEDVGGIYLSEMQLTTGTQAYETTTTQPILGGTLVPKRATDNLSADGQALTATGKTPYPAIVETPAITNAGGMVYLSAPHLTGSEAVVSFEGTTAEPTISAGRIDWDSDEELYSLELSDGTIYTFQEGPGSASENRSVYDVSGNGNHATLVNGTVANIWANRCPGLVKDHCIEYGGRIGDDGEFIPAKLDSSAAADGQPITLGPGKHGNPYSRMDLNPFTAAEYNGRSIPTELAPGGSIAGVTPEDSAFRRTKTTGDDRFIILEEAATGGDLTTLQNYTS